jgi:periplasmic divalent cation tolerance protein
MSDIVQVLTTTATEAEAQAIARSLVDRRLAACVQVMGPIASTYRWQGATESNQEWLLQIKTLGAQFVAVERAIRELHSYEVPEILALPVVAASSDYLHWLQAALAPETD